MYKTQFIPAAASVLILATACSQGGEEAKETAQTEVPAAEDNLGPPPPPDDYDAQALDQQEAASSAAAPPAVIDGITNKRLTFDKGSASTRVSGSITGYETIDYLLNVRAGQSLNVSMATRNTATYFNILEPGETEAAIYNGSTDGNMYEGITEEGGDYRIRIYMMRSAARRNENADFNLEVAVN